MKKTDKGVAVFTTIMFLFILSLVAVGVLLAAYNYNNICEGQIRRLKAMTSAEAGINYAYWYLRNDPGYAGGTLSITLNGIPVTVTVSAPVSGRYTISSKATYQKTTVP